ncbi:MAG: SCO family protein [Gammaproteobacteria bacterium]|nr:SCO family protein [Gammaproteobacteria bacterium]MDH5801836.1 SCO family protein [Gammaproteobacteria bacterium]
MLVTSLSFYVLTANANDATVAEQLKAVLLPEPKQIAPFQLVDQHNRAFTEKSFAHKWTFVFFGYTNCPDICPTTLSELETLSKNLLPVPPMENNVQYVFATVDPKRDTPKQLLTYISYFDENFVALSGTSDQIDVLTRQLNIKYKLGEGYKGDYPVSHSSALLLIDPKGRYFARFPAPHYAKEIRTLFLALNP